MNGLSDEESWNSVPARLAFYDYIGNNPAKGGLFRNGPMVGGDGLALGWFGHATFYTAANEPLYIRRMPTFFETFPVLLLDANGIVKGDLPFRRSESKYSIEQTGIYTIIGGGEFSGLRFTNPPTVNQFARRAQCGEIIDFDRTAHNSDGVFRSSTRGWFTFGHLCFGLIFLFGHWWHGARTLFRDVFSGIDENCSEQVEFGAFRKVGDTTTAI